MMVNAEYQALYILLFAKPGNVTVIQCECYCVCVIQLPYVQLHNGVNPVS
jgi:hypothetical protein